MRDNTFSKKVFIKTVSDNLKNNPRRPHHGRDGAKEHHWPLRGRKAPRCAHQPPAVAGNADESAG